MRTHVLAGMVFLAILSAQADYEVHSDLLSDPQQGALHVKKVADFWAHQKDSLQGGYFDVIDGNGVASSTASKHFSPQSRLGWVFAHAFMLTGDTGYLDHSDHALRFLYAHGWDSSTGGWYYRCTASGSDPSEYSGTRKWSYMQHYALLGIGAAIEAQGGQRFPRNASSPDHWAHWRQGLDWNSTYLWDTAADRQGYFTYAGSLPHSGYGKGFTPTVDAITTHADLASLLSGDSLDLRRFSLLGDAMTDRLVAAMDSPDVNIGFPEEFLSDWRIAVGSYSMVGHMIKTSWCLGRVWLQDPKSKHLAAMSRILEGMWASGAVDTIQGGTSSYFLTGDTPPVPHGEKSYWMTEQAINAGLMNWYLQSDPVLRDRSLRMADLSADFFMKHFVRPSGGSIMTTDWDGNPVDSALGDEWDAGYHSAEIGWLTYLYGNLFLKDQPVSLHYRLTPSDTAQSLKLTPLRLKDDALAILAVQKDGVDYGAFDSSTRILRLPANVGGLFRVTFGRMGTGSSSACRGTHGFDARWSRCTRTVSFRVSRTGPVRIRLFSLDGRLVQSWYDGTMASGIARVVAPSAPAARRLHILVVESDARSEALRILP